MAQESGPAHGFLRWKESQAGKGLRPGCPSVRPLPLGLEYQGEISGHIGTDPRVLHHGDLFRMGGGQQLGKLHLDPLLADIFKVRGDLPDGSIRLPFDGKSQLGCETDGPEDPQSVLCEPVPGTAHAPDHLFLQIPHAVKGVHDPGLMAVRHGVDGKVPAFQILQKAGREFHRIRVTAVPVLSVDAVGGHLIALAVFNNGDRPVLQPCIHSLPKDLLHLFRLCGGGDIPVSRSPAQKSIPDAAAYGKGLEAPFPYFPYDPFCLIGHFYPYIPIHGLPPFLTAQSVSPAYPKTPASAFLPARPPAHRAQSPRPQSAGSS